MKALGSSQECTNWNSLTYEVCNTSFTLGLFIDYFNTSMIWIAKLVSAMIKKIFSYLVIATTSPHNRKRWAQLTLVTLLRLHYITFVYITKSCLKAIHKLSTRGTPSRVVALWRSPNYLNHRNIKDRNILLNKPTEVSVWEGVCCGLSFIIFS